MTDRPRGPRRRIHDAYDLQDLIDQLGQPAELAERDFALVSIAAQLVQDYGDELCFKGGFVLRHVYGHERFSKDIDATRRNPPKHKFDADEVAQSVRDASMRNVLEIEPGTPTTDTGRSLDFDRITYQGPISTGHVALEVSYREAVSELPDLVQIGEPFYDSFQVPVMAINEIVAEKLRALCQRRRATDLSDLAMIFRDQAAVLSDADIVRIAVQKFTLVKDGDRAARIERNIGLVATEYANTVSSIAPDAPDFSTASETVLARIKHLIP